MSSLYRPVRAMAVCAAFYFALCLTVIHAPAARAQSGDALVRSLDGATYISEVKIFTDIITIRGNKAIVVSWARSDYRGEKTFTIQNASFREPGEGGCYSPGCYSIFTITADEIAQKQYNASGAWNGWLRTFKRQ